MLYLELVVYMTLVVNLPGIFGGMFVVDNHWKFPGKTPC